MQPPLPQGDSAELCGSDVWIKAKPELRSKKTRMVWWDMRQPKTGLAGEQTSTAASSETDALLAQNRAESTGDDNWWPGLGRWRLGLWLEDAVLELGEAEEIKLEH